MKTKCKLLSILLAVCMVSYLLPAAVFAQEEVPSTEWNDYAAMSFAGGIGTESDAYQIATAE